MGYVLLTRPRQASEKLAGKLTAQGYACLIAPRLEITPVVVRVPPEMSRVRAVMLTSAHAFAALAKGAAAPENVLHYPCFCVGSRTAEEARAYGFTDVHDANGNGHDLAELVMRRMPGLSGADEAVLHICGRDVSSKARDHLTKAGISVIPWALYEAVRVDGLSKQVYLALREKTVDAILFFSPRTARHFDIETIEYGITPCCEDVLTIGISPDVLEGLPSARWRRREAAARPTEDAMIARLRELVPVTGGSDGR